MPRAEGRKGYIRDSGEAKDPDVAIFLSSIGLLRHRPVKAKTARPHHAGCTPAASRFVSLPEWT